MSFENLYVEIGRKEEKPALIGVSYDIARGLAAKAVPDYQDRQLIIDGMNYMDTKDMRGVVTLSYGV